MPFAGAIFILAILTGFSSGALPVDTSKPVDLNKLKNGEAVYVVNQ